MAPMLAGSGIAAEKLSENQTIGKLKAQPGKPRQHDATGHNLCRLLPAQSVDDHRLARCQTNDSDALAAARKPAEQGKRGGKNQAALAGASDTEAGETVC